MNYNSPADDVKHLVDICKFLSSVKCHDDCDILTLLAIDICGESVSVLLYSFSLIVVDGDVVVHSLRDWGIVSFQHIANAWCFRLSMLTKRMCH